MVESQTSKATNANRSRLSTNGKVLAGLLSFSLVLGFLLTPLGFETRLADIRSLALVPLFLSMSLLIPIAALVSLWRGRPQLAGILAVVDAVLVFFVGFGDQAGAWFTVKPPVAITVVEYLLILVAEGYILFGPRLYYEDTVGIDWGKRLSLDRTLLAALLVGGIVTGFLLSPLGFEPRLPEVKSLLLAPVFVTVLLLLPIVGLVALARGRSWLAGLLPSISALFAFLIGPGDQAGFFFNAPPPAIITGLELVLTAISVGYILVGPRLMGDTYAMCADSHGKGDCARDETPAVATSAGASEGPVNA